MRFYGKITFELNKNLLNVGEVLEQPSIKN